LTVLRTDITTLPRRPGVYLMRDARGEVLYVGKAVDLRARVRQYFKRDGSGDGRFHVAFLVARITQVDVVVTPNEREALILEDTLIKKHQPRYNVRLKDDKTWLSLRLHRGERWPRVLLVRRWKDDGARYFGPFLNELGARKIQALLSRTIPLRTCSDPVFAAHSERPCIEYQMGRCSAPCTNYIGEQDYNALVDEAELLLEGRTDSLSKRLRARMDEAAGALRYEEAARIRDSLLLLQRLAAKKGVQSKGRGDKDVFGLHRQGELAAVALLPVREGRIQEVRAFAFRAVAEEDDQLIGRVITQLYSKTLPPPAEILVPKQAGDHSIRAELLGELAGRKVKIRSPKRGKDVELLEIAASNAKVRFDAAHSRAERAEQSLLALKKALRMTSLPRHIECYDNSNISGTDPVGALVTFMDGRPWKKGYRIFRIKAVEGPDDYASMKEVLGRRLQRALGGDEGWQLPDLVLIDGGRGQLAMVTAVCDELGVRVNTADADQRTAAATAELDARPYLRVISIAKPRSEEETDKIYEPGRSNPLPLRARNAGLQLLQQLRDEAHRFSLSHHRKRRRKRTIQSELDSIPGVGPVLRTRLLQHFGSAGKVRAAPRSEIAAVPGVGAKLSRVIAQAMRPEE
jgi:excinuclease ABC subunit C